jgi:hypothetical protein
MSDRDANHTLSELQEARAELDRRRDRFRTAGQCIDCGAQPKPGRVRCVVCLDRQYQSLKKRRCGG